MKLNDGGHKFNALRPRQNGHHIGDDTFSCIFVNENVTISIKFSLKFVPKGPINNIPTLVQIMAWRRPGDKPLSEPVIVSLLTHIFFTRPQWVNPSRQRLRNSVLSCSNTAMFFSHSQMWVWATQNCIHYDQMDLCHNICMPPTQRSCWGGGCIGFTLPIHLSVHPSNCLSICLYTDSFLLYNLHNIDHNHFIFGMEIAPRD